jgi:hypothetical protein
LLVGIRKLDPGAALPDQRCVTILVRVKNRMLSVPY